MKKYLSTMNVCIALVVLALMYAAIAYYMKWYPFKEEEYNKPKLNWIKDKDPAISASKALKQGAGKEEYYYFTF